MKIGIYGGAAYTPQEGVAQMILNSKNDEVQARLTKLKKMNAHEFETDEAYVYWIEEGIPDDISDIDLQYIAENIEIYNEVCVAFKRALILDV